MQRGAIVLVALLVALPLSSALAQNPDSKTSLAVELAGVTPYHYRADDGRTVVIGEARNTKDFPVTGVSIWAGFFDDRSRVPLASTTGATLLDVIPPNGWSPYVIFSPDPNESVTNVSVNLLTFTSAGPKNRGLVLEGEAEYTQEGVSYYGQVSNRLGVEANGTRIHMIMYDSFEPPRLIRASTIQLDAPVVRDDPSGFLFEEELPDQAAGFYLMAESDGLLSNMLDEKTSRPDLITKKITINGTSTSDADGNKTTTVQANSTILIRGSLSIQVAPQDDSYGQDYVYYAQVKQVGTEPYVEYIGTVDGRFDGPAPQNPVIEWTPENVGWYYVETFVWDPDGVPLASRGPVAFIQVS